MEKGRFFEMLWVMAILCLSACIGCESRMTQKLELRRRRRSLLANGLGLTPPMGWNSWNKFSCSINETLIKETSDALVSTGFAKLGYKYVNLDDCWAEDNRTSEGRLIGKKSKFPSGIKALADYVHSKGLKLGVYSSAGYRTCSNQMPGSLNYEYKDAETFAEWGIDYLKYDNCYNGGIDETKRYPIMTKALKKAGRPIFYSLCEWGHEDVATWGAMVGNSWRTTGDINDTWISMIQNINLNDANADYAGPGGWNDPDMLEVGNGGMTKNEYIAHYSLWAITKAPLLIGCDVRKMSEETKEILTNEEVIAVNQDPLGVQAKKVKKHGDLEVWAGPLCEGRTVLLLLNKGCTHSRKITVHLHRLGFSSRTVLRVRDLWKHETLEGTYRKKLTARVEPHSVKMFVLDPMI